MNPPDVSGVFVLAPIADGYQTSQHNEKIMIAVAIAPADSCCYISPHAADKAAPGPSDRAEPEAP